MTSLVTRRAGGRGRGNGAEPPGDDDSGWQPSRSVRKPGGRSVPADRRRTPNPVTDTNSLQPVASGPGDRSAAPTGRSGERGADTGERRRRTAERAARGSTTGPGARRAAGRSGDATGAHGVPRRRAAHRDSASSDLLEPTDRPDDPLDDEDELPSEDRLAWLRQGWIGPLAVALAVALLAVGGYVLLRGNGGDGASPAPSASADASSTPATTNPDALIGKAMIDGSWQCRLVTGTNPLKLSNDVVGVLVVARTAGSYTWQGTPGEYTITPVSGNDGGNVIGDVKFTSGPLKDLTAMHIAKPGAGIRGKAQGTLELKPSGSAPHRFCGVN
jgi:integrin beta 3